MQLSTIPKDFIINAASEEGGKVTSNFLLHGLRIKNDLDENITLKDINFEFYSSGDFIKQVTFQGKSLENNIEIFSEKVKGISQGFGAKLHLGQENFWNPELTTRSVNMTLNQETGIYNEYFVVVYSKVIDELIIKVNYIKDEEEYIEELKLPLIQYKNKNEYIFPLKGSISTVAHYNSLMDHRQHYSMEFAFDMAQLDADQKLCFKDNMSKEDYTIYGKDILAIADGEVVAYYSSFTVTTSWNWKERKPYIDEYGLPAQCGNYIVLKHANGEYSFYGHLAVDSLTVKKGDMVKQGQVIAKVGHTGMSSCPHLHFQLMDGPDFLSDRGLPCCFSNAKDVSGNKVDLMQDDDKIVHAE
jgi:hypothetical protein